MAYSKTEFDVSILFYNGGSIDINNLTEYESTSLKEYFQRKMPLDRHDFSNGDVLKISDCVQFIMQNRDSQSFTILCNIKSINKSGSKTDNWFPFEICFVWGNTLSMEISPSWYYLEETNNG